MRVLVTVHAFLPHSTAGVEVYAFRQAQALQRMGHQVRVFSAVHDLAAPAYSVRHRQHQGVDVAEIVNVHHEGTLEATYDNPGVDRAAEGVLRDFRPDVVHVQHLLNLSAGILRSARQAGATIVFTLHDYWLSCPRDGLRMRADLALCEGVDHAVCSGCLEASPYLVPALQRGLSGLARRAGLGQTLHRLHHVAPRATEAALRALRRTSPPMAGLAEAMDRRAQQLRKALEDVDLFLAPTRFVRDRTVEFGVPAERVLVSPYGAVEAPTLARPAKRRTRLGYVGTLAPHKGVHVLVEAFKGLDAAEATLDVHGSLAVQPSYADALRRAAQEDPRIRFRGGFAEGGQPAVLAELDALVVPSVWWENSPLTILEALARGVPVIASGIGGMPELVAHDETGLIVPAGDVAALRGALADVASGRRLGNALAAVPLKTVEQGVRELVSHCQRLALQIRQGTD